MKQPQFWRSLQYAIAGLVFTIRTQRNARIHIVMGTLVIGLGLWLRLHALQFSILALAIGGVFAGEVINTSVEAIVDLLSPDWHERAKVAKDVSAGGVLVLSIAAIIVGLLILGPPLWEKFFQLPLVSG